MTSRTLLVLLLAASPSRALVSVDPAADGDELVPSPNVPSGVRQAAQQSKTGEDETPAALRWMLEPLDRGMFVRIPVIDSDPNRGITYGVMPILVLQGKNDDRISQIHAPSLTYNEVFKLTPTYRYYYYPQENASLDARASRGKYEHEVMAEYIDQGVFGTPYDLTLYAQKNRDAGQRFYGFGPDSPKNGQSNYIQDYWRYNWGLGAPLREGSAWRARLSQRYIASRIIDGPIPGLPVFDEIYPQQFSTRAQQTNETRAALEYDTRDHAVTTGSGAFFNTYAEASVRGYMSEYDYERYGAEYRWFEPVPGHPAQTIALQGRYEQILGPTPPFWLLPSMGGKYSLRAYGDGRYADRGTATFNIEDRIKMYEAKTAGVTTEIQFAPFVGVGNVFDNPEDAAGKYSRPVVGAAVRAVAKPQVVGSVDFGVGREGLAIFTDINYSF